MIMAPYNFIPLNSNILYPNWNHDVTHDIPFEDGENAEITLEIEAKTSIFIRNHFQDGDDAYTNKSKEKISKEFCHVKLPDGAKQYFIPGSSFKGMIRNLTEIISFSKIKIDEEKHNKNLSVRDMTQDKKTGTLYNYPMVATAQRCGFLKINSDGTGVLQDCGRPIVIHHQELQSSFNIPGIKEQKTAKSKYKKYGERELTIKVVPDGRRKKAIKNGANKQGQLVFTGDITNKKHEFIFIKNAQEIKIKQDVIDNFKKVYFHNEESEDGQYWLQKLKKEQNILIPIFYIGNEKSVDAIGLTQIFKLAYNKTILEAAQQHSDPLQLDMTETMFGTEKENIALKGRVQFSHFKSNTIRYEAVEKQEILGTPNPTYFPNYIRQTNISGSKVNKYMTLMDPQAQISGYKRYPLQPNIQTSASGNDNKDVKTRFKPLNKGTVFEGKLRFHNLKKIEIGALLSALTFHGQNDKLYHNIGMAKPLGYGKISLTIADTKNLKYSVDEYLQCFEDYMNSWNNKEYDKWIDSIQIKSLFAMADNSKAKPLTYQLLEDKRKKNHFVEDKKVRKYLQGYTHSSNQNTQVQVKKTHVESNTPLSENQENISKTKIKKTLQEAWQRVFNIFYHPNQIKEFFEGEFKTTPEDQVFIYQKLQENEKFISLLKEIDKFNKDQLNDEEKQKLYKVLIDLK